MPAHPNSNPFVKAAGAYGSAATVTDQRTLEGQVLLESATKLELLAKRLRAKENVSLEEIDLTLAHNRKLWLLFLDGMMDPTHLLPQEIKNNVASLAMYVMKRTNEILIETSPEKFDVLININRNIAAGLLKAPPAPAKQAAPAPEKPVAQKPETATDSLA